MSDTRDVIQRLRARGHWVVTKRVPLFPQENEEEWRVDAVCGDAADEIESLRAERDHYRQALADISPVDLRDIGPHLRCPARCVKGGAELDPFDRTNHHPECPWVEARSIQLQENQ